MTHVPVRAEIRVAGPGYSLKPGDMTVVDDSDPRVARQIARGALTVLDIPAGPFSGAPVDLGPDPGVLAEPPPPR